MTQSGKSKGGHLRALKNPQTDHDANASDSAPASKSGRTEACPRCFGTGMEIIPGEGAHRCDCQASDQLRRLFQSARIPARYRHCELNNFEANVDDRADFSKLRAKGEAI